MQVKNPLIFSVILQILIGLIVAFLSSLLVYFKQKEVLHLGVVLFSVLAVFYTNHLLSSKAIKTGNPYKVVLLILLFLVGFLGPQFVYQIRPYTFYISGFALAGVVITALASNTLNDNKSINFPWKIGIFLVTFFVGYFMSWHILQYIIIGLSILLAVDYIVKANLPFKLAIVGSISLMCLVFWWFAKPIIHQEEQANYEDKVLFSAETQFHKIVITQWHRDHWIFMDKLKNVSSIDEYLFYEPMAHSVFKIGNGLDEVLVIGGENGCLIREILKHESVKKIEVISYDTLLRNFGVEQDYFTSMNQGAFKHEKVDIIHEDLIQFISSIDRQYDAIFIDLPDPRSVETNQYYTIEFYEMVIKILGEDGIMITQAGSPYFATEAFFSIGQTISKAGFSILPIHNQILTLGEWGWYICSKDLRLDYMKEQLVKFDIPEIETKWFNQEAARLVSAFGKTNNDTLNVGINSLENPVVYQYYLKGNWEMN